MNVIQRLAWNSSLLDYLVDQNAFLFSLTNDLNKPFKMQTIDASYSIWGSPKCGPIFGDCDFRIKGRSALQQVLQLLKELMS